MPAAFFLANLLIRDHSHAECAIALRRANNRNGGDERLDQAGRSNDKGHPHEFHQPLVSTHAGTRTAR
jgi:hypothetical protein